MSGRGGGGDAGYSLAELLVVIVLFAVVGSIIVVATTTGLHHQTKIQDRADALAQMRTAMQRVERDIRSSDGLGLMRGDLVTLVEKQATATRTMTYSLVADGTSYDLVVDESDDGTPVPRKTLLAHIVNPAGTALFSYSPWVGYTPPADSGISETDCSVTGYAPAVYAPSCIGVVTMHLMVQPPSLPAPIDLTDNGTEVRNSA